jgi:anti-sigma regulatory factor (Ser/Thr protein kinase)
MAPLAVTFTETAFTGCLASRLRLPHRHGKPAAGRGFAGTPTSWLARHRALWSRTLEPLHPLDTPAARPTTWDASWPLPRALTSVRRARHLVTGQLSDWALGDLTETAELLVSEVVTNALRHAIGPLRLNLRVRSARLRCEVEDTNPAGPVRRVVDADSEGGRGTKLLDLLAAAWGSTRTATGKTTWFELAATRPCGRAPEKGDQGPGPR